MVLSDVIKILFVSETDDVEEFGVPLGLIFFSPGVTTPIGGCILQPSSGL